MWRSSPRRSSAATSRTSSRPSARSPHAAHHRRRGRLPLLDRSRRKLHAGERVGEHQQLRPPRPRPRDQRGDLATHIGRLISGDSYRATHIGRLYGDHTETGPAVIRSLAVRLPDRIDEETGMSCAAIQRTAAPGSADSCSTETGIRRKVPEHPTKCKITRRNKPQHIGTIKSLTPRRERVNRHNKVSAPRRQARFAIFRGDVAYALGRAHASIGSAPIGPAGALRGSRHAVRRGRRQVGRRCPEPAPRPRLLRIVERGRPRLALAVDRCAAGRAGETLRSRFASVRSWAWSPGSRTVRSSSASGVRPALEQIEEKLPYGMHRPITSSFPSGHAASAFTAATVLAGRPRHSPALRARDDGGREPRLRAHASRLRHHRGRCPRARHGGGRPEGPAPERRVA